MWTYSQRDTHGQICVLNTYYPPRPALAFARTQCRWEETKKCLLNTTFYALNRTDQFQQLQSVFESGSSLRRLQLIDETSLNLRVHVKPSRLRSAIIRTVSHWLSCILNKVVQNKLTNILKMMCKKKLRTKKTTDLCQNPMRAFVAMGNGTVQNRMGFVHELQVVAKLLFWEQ